ncbi:MAG: calcium-binding protein [Geminicoccaceae bacterium]
MPTFIVPKAAAAGGGVAVPAGFEVVDFSQVGSGIIVRSEPNYATQGGAPLATWGDAVTTAIGTGFNDVLLGDADGQKLYGGGGHDRLQDGGAGAAASSLWGDAGNDRLFLAADGSRGDGGTGNDSFYITDASGARAFGGIGTDRFYVRDVDHLTVYGGKYGDALSVNGGEVLRVNLGEGNDRAALRDVDDAIVSGGNGHDTINVYGGSAIRLSGSYGNDRVGVVDSDGARVSTGEGNDKVFFRDADNVVVNAGNGNDIVNMGEATHGHVLVGGAGIDTVTYWDVDASTSDNVIIDLELGVIRADGVDVAAISGFERAYSEAGDDKLVGSADNNVLSAGAGADRIFGGEGNDIVYGGDGADFVVGGHGRDVIDGGAGDDYFKAGLDGDRFVFKTLHAGETDTISILGRLDTLDFRGSVSDLADLTITINADKSASITAEVDGGVHTLILERLLSVDTLTTELAQHVLVG